VRKKVLYDWAILSQLENKKIFLVRKCFPKRRYSIQSNPSNNKEINIIPGSGNSSPHDWHTVCHKQARPEFHGWKRFFQGRKLND